MKLREIALGMESLLCGGVLTGMAIYGLPLGLAGTIGLMFSAPYKGLVALLWVIGCAFALIGYWRLALATVFGNVYRFGVLFWFGVIGAAYGIFEMQSWWAGNMKTSLALFGPIVLATAHFMYLQITTVQVESE